ncbi:hypothetical protein Tco_0828152 [Tanacetum coccineum]
MEMMVSYRMECPLAYCDSEVLWEQWCFGSPLNSLGSGGLWCNIVKVVRHIDDLIPTFKNSFHLNVSNGLCTSFWTDPWCGNGLRLMDVFSRLFTLDSQQDCKVSDRWCQVDGVWGGNWSWRLPPHGRAISDLSNLNSLIGHLYLSVGSTDKWSGRAIALGSLRLATRTNLSHRGVNLVSELCPFCDSTPEVLDNSQGKIKSNGCARTNKALQWVFKCVLWAVWNRRNKVVNADPDLVGAIKEEGIFPFIQHISKSWISARCSLNPTNWSCWISRPFGLSCSCLLFSGVWFLIQFWRLAFAAPSLCFFASSFKYSRIDMHLYKDKDIRARGAVVPNSKSGVTSAKWSLAPEMLWHQNSDDTSANIICNSPSPVDAETGVRSDKTSSGSDTKIVQITEELGEDVENQENVEEKTMELDQDQAGSDPGKTLESRPQLEQVHIEEDQAGPDPGISRVALARPDPEPMHDKFMADLYPKVQESLKFLADEHVSLEDPLSSTGTLSSMKNLEDAYAIGDQFINDKSTDDELGKLNVEAEVVSMVTVLIYQASSSIPPLTTESELDEHVTALEKKLSDLEQTNKNLDNTTRNIRSRVYTLDLRDLPHKINEAVRKNVKEAVQIALQAPLRDRFRDLSEEDMKEMLHQRMFETSSYKSLLEHITLYEALKASMERVQMNEFLAEKDKSHKRRCDDQDPPPPPPNSDQNNERPATQEPASVIPTSHIPDAINNWANALATTYQAPAENSLLEKTGDMRTFMNCFPPRRRSSSVPDGRVSQDAYRSD